MLGITPTSARSARPPSRRTAAAGARTCSRICFGSSPSRAATMCTGTPCRQRQRRRRVPQRVQAPGRDAGGLAVLAEPLREPLRVDRPAERVGEHEIAVDVGGPAKSRSRSCVSRCARSMSTVTGSSATVRRDRADFGGPNVAPPRVGTSCCSTEQPRAVEVERAPRQAGELAAAHPGRRREPPERASRSSATCSRNRRSSPAVHACARLPPRDGGSAMRATLRGTRPHRSASRSARPRTACTSRRVADGEAGLLELGVQAVQRAAGEALQPLEPIRGLM